MNPVNRIFALLFRFSQRLGCAIWANEQFRVVVPADSMDLPEIEVVGLKATQRLFQHFGGEAGFAAVGADLGHEEDFVAAALQALAHPVFRFAAMVFPAVVEEGDAAIDCFLDDSNRGGNVWRIAEMVAAKAECRNTDIVPAKRLHRDWHLRSSDSIIG